MKVKLNDVVNLYISVRDIIDNKKHDLSPICQFRLLGILKSIESHVQNFEVIRNKKIIEYGKEDDEGNISIPPNDKENIKKFNIDMESVANDEVEINTNIKIKSTDILNKKINTTTLMLLYPFIEE